MGRAKHVATKMRIDWLDLNFVKYSFLKQSWESLLFAWNDCWEISKFNGMTFLIWWLCHHRSRKCITIFVHFVTLQQFSYFWSFEHLTSKSMNARNVSHFYRYMFLVASFSKFSWCPYAPIYFPSVRKCTWDFVIGEIRTLIQNLRFIIFAI